MRSLAPLALAAICPALLAGCVSPYLSAEARKQACEIAVEEKFASALFKPNSLSGAAGPLAGAGQGFVGGGQVGGQGALLTAPIGFIVGAAVGTACAVAGAQHPNADRDFERLLHDADTGLVKRTLEARLKTPRPECPSAVSDRPAGALPDARVEIEAIQAGMSCLIGRQEFWVAAKWRTVAKTGRVLNETTSRREYKSPRSTAEWFADASSARLDIERTLQQVGEDMAAQFFAATPD
jgi:hypothetical protein